MLNIIRTNQFLKDAKLQKKRGKNLKKLFVVIDLLSKEQKLNLKYKVHKLVGNYKLWTECHIESDWLLIYTITSEGLILARTGSHADLFK